MDILDKIERISEKYLRFAENHYVNAVVGLLLIFTVSEEIMISLKSGDFKFKAEHGLFFLYLNLVIISIARICKAYIHHKNVHDASNS